MDLTVGDGDFHHQGSGKSGSMAMVNRFS